ncbi:MAG TPA: DUF2092 domain-containing protein [Thermopolyspora sp.]
MRWVVPVAAVAVVAVAAGAGPVIAAVQGDPVLPKRTAEQLLVKAIETAHADGPRAMSGTIIETASLGLPELPTLGGESSTPISLLSGSHELRVWYGGGDKMRLALPGQMSETDLIHNGDQTWLWDSAANTATRIRPAKDVAALGHRDGMPGHGVDGMTSGLTPQAVAQEMLKRAGDDTAISVTDNEQVAGRDAYQLELVPKDDDSLIRKITLALDGQNYVPLRVQVFADGAAEPAFEVGYGSVTFTQPAAEMFAFTPPAGAKVTEKTLGRPQAPAQAGTAARKAGEAKRIGKGWTTVVSVPFKEADLAKPTPEKGHDAGSADALVKNVLKSAKPVSGTWGSGKLIQTKLLNILVTNDGRLLAGAVTPEVLTAAAGEN